MAKTRCRKISVIIITLLRIILICFGIFIICTGAFLLIKIVRSEKDSPYSSKTVSVSDVVPVAASVSCSASSTVSEASECFEFSDSANKQVKTRRELYSDGSVRGEYEYDEYGRLRYFKSHSSETITSVTFDDSFEIIETYTNEKHFGDEYYDSQKRLVRLNNLKNGCEYLYTYDDFGNLIKEEYYTTVNTSRHSDYKYDDNGLLIFTENYINGSLCSTYTYEYNDAFLLNVETYSFITSRSDWETVVSRYEYDKFGRKIRLLKTWASTGKYYCENYVYSSSGLSCTIDYGTYFKSGVCDEGSANGCITYTYDSVGNVLEQITSLLNGNTTVESHEYVYDEDRCILKESVFLNGELSSVNEYTYY